MFKSSSIINSTLKRISTTKTLRFVGGLVILLGICISLTFGLSVSAFAVPLSGYVNVEDIDIQDDAITAVNGDLTIDISGLTADRTFLTINSNEYNLTITGNSRYKLIITNALIGGNGNLIVNGGNIEVNGYINFNDFTMSGGSLDCGGSFNVSDANIIGGELTVGVNSNGSIPSYPGIRATNISVSGGNINIRNRETGLSVSNTISISGGTIGINLQHDHSVDGLFSENAINISGGNIDIVTSVEGNTNPNYVASAINCTADNISIRTDLVDIIVPENASIGAFYHNSGVIHGILNSDGTIARSVTIRPKQNTNNNPSNNIGGEDVGGAPKVQIPPHVHSYRWEVIQSPTAESDGWEAYKCSGCGDIKERSPLPAMSVFDEEVIAKIKKAPIGGTVKIETTHWNSLGRSIRDALAARPDVTLCISFLSEGYRGIPLKVTLPAGIDIVGLFDENGYLGLCRAGTELGYDQ